MGLFRNHRDDSKSELDLDNENQSYFAPVYGFLHTFVISTYLDLVTNLTYFSIFSQGNSFLK
jgi:hypothetical protein